MKFDGNFPVEVQRNRRIPVNNARLLKRNHIKDSVTSVCEKRHEIFPMLVNLPHQLQLSHTNKRIK